MAKAGFFFLFPLWFLYSIHGFGFDIWRETAARGTKMA
jgi:hypothetical protein